MKATTTMVKVSALEQMMVNFYKVGFQFYELTGHDLLENPDKQDLLLNTDRYAALVAEGKKELAQVEEKVKQVLGELEKESQVTPGWYRDEAIMSSRLRCAGLLEVTTTGVHFRHLSMMELSRRGLLYTL